MATITITFGDQAENHVGMQKIGSLAPNGFNFDDLNAAKSIFTSKGYPCELIHLNTYLNTNADDAYLLIIRNGVESILKDINKTTYNLFDEQNNLNVDKKAKMYGRVVNKTARYNLCFDNVSQEPDYEQGKGRIVAYNEVPLTSFIRNQLPLYFGDKATQLTGEGNYYYDVTRCFIGWHGDGERRRVIAVRLGETFPMHFQWFLNSVPVGERIKLSFNSGDIYAMSEKATGFDWKKKKIYTLRHAAGAEKYLKIKEKKNKNV